MGKYTYIFYFIIVAIAIISSVVKRLKKGNAQQNQSKIPAQKSSTNTNKSPGSQQPKSLEDILQSLLNEQKTTQKANPTGYMDTVKSDKEPVKSTTLEDAESLESIEEEKYYSFDSELAYNNEEEDYDNSADHRLHGKGFDIEEVEEVGEEQEDWSDIDWRKAVITAEVLRRPEY